VAREILTSPPALPARILPAVLYAFIRAVVGAALRLFYKVRLAGSSAPLEGPVMFVGNHPNALVDPALVFVVTPRHVTFLAKAPLFRMPVLAQLLKGIGALPVYRKQDNPTMMAQNEGTLEAAAGALVEGRAITIFPEGRSHSEPQLGELKTGAARIALRAVKQGAPVRIVPVGLTYAEKDRFRSEVLIQVGEPIDARAFGDASDAQAARALTDAIAEGLRRVTLNLGAWEDLPLLQTAEALYALRVGERARDPDRLRLFARGAQLLRSEQPERYDQVREELLDFQRRLAIGRASPSDLALEYRPTQVAWFVLRNLAMLLFGLPLVALGLVAFWLPYQIPSWLTDFQKPELDMVATVKLLAAMVVAPMWLLVLALVFWWKLGVVAAVLVIVLALPLALFTRYFVEHWQSVLSDVRVFFTLGNRARTKALLMAEGERLSTELERLATELGPRVNPTAPAT